MKNFLGKLPGAARAVLRFLNLLDRGNKISLSNSLVWVGIWLIAKADQPNVAEVGVIVIAMFNYMQKRSETNKLIREEAKASDIAAVESTVTKLTAEVASYKDAQELIAKQAEDTKKLLSTSNLAAAFGPRKRGE